MIVNSRPIYIVGAGLSGCECAYQLAEMGFQVHLFEMRGTHKTPAHKTSDFAELVCSNSFGSETDYSAPGQLKWEAKALQSMILDVGQQMRVPAGMALSVDREAFARKVTEIVRAHPNITIHETQIDRLSDLPRPLVIATGPLTSESLSQDLRAHFDHEFLYFFDAIAPILSADSIDTEIAWKADRFDKGTKDYYNCPMNQDQYFQFIEEIKKARKIESKEFEKTPYFQGCMPIEAIVESGDQTLRFGPLSPKGLKDPRTGHNAYAVVQLRQDNKAATAFNMVGFQTKMAYSEQQRIFRMIPGLENAEFLKLGSIHRNLYIQSPKKLTQILSSHKDPELFFAGQITGVEGYFESTCIGLLIAHFIRDLELKRPVSLPPRATAFGSLLNAITEDNEDFQPTNINFGLFPPALLNSRDKRAKREWQLSFAKSEFEKWLSKEWNFLAEKKPSLSSMAIAPGP